MKASKPTQPWRFVASFAQKLFPKNVFDRPGDFAVLRRRVVKQFISPDWLEILLAPTMLGVFASCSYLFSRLWQERSASSATEWLLKTTTDVDMNFLYPALVLAAALLTTHKARKDQSLFRRTVALSLFRFTADGVLVAGAAFIVLAIVCWAGPSALVVGDGPAALVVTSYGAFRSAGFFLFCGLYMAVIRFIVDSSASDVWFAEIHGRAPGLERIFWLAGGGSVATFTLIRFCFR